MTLFTDSHNIGFVAVQKVPDHDLVKSFLCQSKQIFERRVIMLLYVKKSLLFFCATIIMISVCFDVIAATDIPLVDLQLTVKWGDDEKEKIPNFQITVTNISGAPIRVLDIGSRLDLVDSFCDVIIVPVDQDFELSRAISDPNVITEKDFVILSPRQSIEFVSILLPIDYRELVPGKYLAYAVYEVDPLNRPNEIIRSDDIFFEID